MMKSEFNQDGKIEFYQVKGKPFDTRRLQAAMFMDRPDLYEKPQRKRHKRVPREQGKLFLKRGKNT